MHWESKTSLRKLRVSWCDLDKRCSVAENEFSMRPEEQHDKTNASSDRLNDLIDDDGRQQEWLSVGSCSTISFIPQTILMAAPTLAKAIANTECCLLTFLSFSDNVRACNPTNENRTINDQLAIKEQSTTPATSKQLPRSRSWAIGNKTKITLPVELERRKMRTLQSITKTFSTMSS